MRAMTICCFIKVSAEFLNFTCSLDSRVKALITLMPARFSCRIVLRAESFCCTSVNSGRLTMPKIIKRINATGKIHSVTTPAGHWSRR